MSTGQTQPYAHVISVLLCSVVLHASLACHVLPLQYQSVVQEITGGDGHSRGPPRIEFSYIRQLQQDNSELRTLLEEHQAALEIIMSKYRDQVVLTRLLSFSKHAWYSIFA